MTKLVVIVGTVFCLVAVASSMAAAEKTPPSFSGTHTFVFSMPFSGKLVEFTEWRDEDTGESLIRFKGKGFTGDIYNSITPHAFFYVFTPDTGDSVCNRGPYDKADTSLPDLSSATYVGTSMCKADRSGLECDIWEWIDEQEGTHNLAWTTVEEHPVPVYFSASPLDGGDATYMKVLSWSDDVDHEVFTPNELCLVVPEVSKSFSASVSGWDNALPGGPSFAKELAASWDDELFVEHVALESESSVITNLLVGEKGSWFTWTDDDPDSCGVWPYEGRDEFPVFGIPEDASMMMIEECDQREPCETWSFYDEEGARSCVVTATRAFGSQTFAPLTWDCADEAGQAVAHYDWEAWKPVAPGSGEFYNQCE